MLFQTPPQVFVMVNHWEISFQEPKCGQVSTTRLAMVDGWPCVSDMMGHSGCDGGKSTLIPCCLTPKATDPNAYAPKGYHKLPIFTEHAPLLSSPTLIFLLLYSHYFRQFFFLGVDRSLFEKIHLIFILIPVWTEDPEISGNEGWLNVGSKFPEQIEWVPLVIIRNHLKHGFSFKELKTVLRRSQSMTSNIPFCEQQRRAMCIVKSIEHCFWRALWTVSSKQSLLDLP